MNLSNWDLNIRASQEAYNQAGSAPEDIDLAEVHDCFTISEIVHYESLGFCKKGEAVKLKEKKTQLEEGSFQCKRPVGKGTSCRLHGNCPDRGPFGNSGGEAGKRQVENAR
jgi:hypothetical protein